VRERFTETVRAKQKAPGAQEGKRFIDHGRFEDIEELRFRRKFHSMHPGWRVRPSPQ
jgi:hypothetical protein